jgi:hypothetical protein
MGFLTTTGMIASSIIKDDYAEANDLLAMVEREELAPIVDYVFTTCEDIFTLEQAYLMYEMACQINPLVRSKVLPKWSAFLRNNLFDGLFPDLMPKKDYWWTDEEGLWLSDKGLNNIYIYYRYMPRMHLIYKVIPRIDELVYQVVYSVDVPFFSRLYDRVLDRYNELSASQFYYYIKNLQHGIVSATGIDIVELMPFISNEYIDSISVRDDVNLLWLEDVLKSLEDDDNKLIPLPESEHIIRDAQKKELIAKGFNEEDIVGFTYEVPETIVKRLRHVFLHPIVFGLFKRAGLF